MTLAEQEQAVEALRRACAETGREMADKVFAPMLDLAARGASEADLNAIQKQASDFIVEEVGKTLRARIVMNEASAEHFGIIAENAFFARLEALSAGLIQEGGHA